MANNPRNVFSLYEEVYTRVTINDSPTFASIDPKEIASRTSSEGIVIGVKLAEDHLVYRVRDLRSGRVGAYAREEVAKKFPKRESVADTMVTK